ncbi:MAG: zinc ribbon domain-containing protein [Armatimonadetes bacterium]|nr:zinc ribbon domain-containing protein [Armatimonadota bacterium]
MSAATYCPTCGYPNDHARGACLLCYTNVRDGRGGSACPSCGADNAKTSNFCMSCQAALTEGVVPQMLPDVSGLVGAAAGMGVGAAVMSDEYVGEPAGDMDFGLGEAEDEFATAGDFTDEFAAPPPPPAAVDTGAADFTPAPGAVDFGEEDFSAPPPPPDTVDLDLDDVGAAPPPPPGTDQLPADTGGDELGDWSLDYDE